MAEDVGNIGGLLTPREDYVPRIQSAYGAIIQNAPDYQYFTAPLSNQGRNTATYGGQNNIVVAPDTPIRVVNNATGEVVFSGVGYEGAQAAIDAAKALSASTGRKADWDIQVTRPGGTTFESVSTDRPDDMLSDIAGMALPIAVNFIPGLQGIGAVLANAAAGAGGAAIAGNDPLKGAIMGGLTSAGTQFLGPLVQSANGAATNLGRAVGTAAGATAGGLATGRSIENSLLGGAIAGGSSYLGGELFGGSDLASDDLVTQNINRALANLENGLIEAGAFAPDLLTAAYKGQGAFNPDGTQVTNWPGGKPPSYTNTTTAGDTVVTADVSGNAATTGTTGSTPSITITGTSANATDTKAADTKNDGPPITITGTGANATDTNANTTTNNDGPPITITGTQNTSTLDSEDVYKGNLTYIPSLVDDLVQQELNGDTKDKDKKVTDTISDVIKYAGTAGTIYDLIKRLFGGGGDGTVPGLPYVSPFGPGTGLGSGFAARTQINPNITDYEKYGFGPEALFFSGGQTSPGAVAAPATTTAATQPASTAAATTPAATTPAATTTNLLDSAAGGGSGGGADVGTNGSVRLTLTEGASGGSPVILEGGNKGPATPENTGMTQERLDQLQERYDNMRSGEFFNYFKAVNDVLGNYVAKGVITPDIAKQYQSRLETAASTPNATLASLQAAVPMPQISQFIKPTGTRPVYTYTAPSQPITDRSAYINDLYKQLGAQFSQGLLAAPQVQNIQGQLRQAYLNPQSTIEQFQNIFNTGMQQYKPLI